jgi:xanthosine utilization system XapX-like protein
MTFRLLMACAVWKANADRPSYRIAPVVGRVRIPHPEQVAHFGALGALAAFEIVEWPIALVLAAGHVMAQDQHNRVMEEIGEALDEA